ncbi:MAG: hypothetical protein ACQEUZ_18545 [Pseudomonadota bacterium]
MAEESETRPEKPVDAPDPKESRRRESVRRWSFYGVVAVSMAAAAIAGLAGPVASLGDNTTSWVWMLQILVVAMLVGGLGWLAVYIMIPPAGRRKRRD